MTYKTLPEGQGVSPLLSIIVPAYNASDYLDRCLRTMVGFGDRVEVIIVNDGSSDDTQEVAQGWVDRHPQSVRLITQENRGHGGALNTGIAAAQGAYLKVVDSDDWLSRSALSVLLTEISNSLAQGENVDMFVTNYVYEKRGRPLKAVIRYGNILPVSQTVGWEHLGYLTYAQYLMMHAITYRTQVVRDSGMHLPEHTFYVDFIYSFTPLPGVKTLRYVDVDLYRYFIGRDDQSVHESVMVTRTDQLLRVNTAMLEAMPDPEQVPARLYTYMIHYLRINTACTCVFLSLAGGEEHLEQREDLWRRLRSDYPQIDRALRRGILGRGIAIPGKLGRRLGAVGYRLAATVLGFN